MRISDQITLADVSPEYAAFVDKFKPKKTTDDCYTPDNIYDAVLDWVVNEYGIDRDKVMRPFWPGADYREIDYPDGCTVVDNPPFSIVTRICKDYINAGVPFFLFSPYLTNIGICQLDVTHVLCGAKITYENGAEVATAFVTNLDGDYVVRTAPDLKDAIDRENRKNTKPAVELPKYEYPVNVFSSNMGGWLAKYGIDFRIRRSDAFFIRALDSQRAARKSIFGSGLLLSEKAAAEKAAAEGWKLSDREMRIIESLGEKKGNKIK